MEIIHLILGKANPNRMNGVNKVVFELAKRQTATNTLVSVWGLSSTPLQNDETRPFDLKVFRAYTNLFRLDTDLIKALTQKKDNAVVHIHGSWIPTFFTLSKQLKKMGMPYIIFAHGGYNLVARQKSAWRKKIYFELFEKHIIQHAEKVHCIGESEVEGLSKLGFAEKAILLPYGFEAQALVYSFEKNENPTFCYMGRMDSHTKGLDLLLGAFAKLVQKFPLAKLSMIGEGEDLEKLKGQTVEQGLQKSVHFFGALYGQEKMDQMAKTHVFVHPSRNEGLPSAIFEAASLQLPIIATRATNLGSSIEQHSAGWAIENNSETALLNAMIESIETSGEQISILGKNANKMLQMDFNWKTVLTKYQKMYHDAYKK